MSRKTLSTRAVDNRGRRLLASATLPHRGPDPGAGSLEAARVGWAMLVVGLLAVVAAAAGIVVPATHGTRTTADEPQYLLTASSLAEDGDLDIADELADGRWRPFHALPLPEQTEPLADGRRLGRGQAGHDGHGRVAGRPGPVDRGAPPGRAGRHRRPGRRGVRLLAAPGRLR